jgi:predicted nucleotide-binding protein (sugar kinase/HSP70/actin superfamily)
VEHLLKHVHESPIARLMDNIRPYYEPALDTEAVLSMGKSIDFAQNGLCGILNIMPFSCMPGIIVAGMAPRLRADLDNIPWLDIIYDAQGGTNINTRLEAFMYQAVQFQRRSHRLVAGQLDERIRGNAEALGLSAQPPAQFLRAGTRRA